MGTHPIFESDFDCLTDPCFLSISKNGSSVHRTMSDRMPDASSSVNGALKDNNRFEIVFCGMMVLFVVIMMVILIVFGARKRATAEKDEEDSLASPTTHV